MPHFDDHEMHGLRSRKNIVMLCKAIIKMAEGPGEIDHLIHDVCNELARLEVLMHDAHSRALEEEEERAAFYENVATEMEGSGKLVVKQAIRDFLAGNPDEKERIVAMLTGDQDDNDWSILENIKI